MATETDALIMVAFLEHLKLLVLTPALPIALPGITFPSGGGAKPDNYLQASFLPNVTETLSVGSGHQMHRGVFQVSVWWKAGDGFVKPLDVAGAVIRHFPKGMKLYAGDVGVKIDGKPWTSAPVQGDDRAQIPVTIAYNSFNQ